MRALALLLLAGCAANGAPQLPSTFYPSDMTPDEMCATARGILNGAVIGGAGAWPEAVRQMQADVAALCAPVP